MTEHIFCLKQHLVDTRAVIMKTRLELRCEVKHAETGEQKFMSGQEYTDHSSRICWIPNPSVQKGNHNNRLCAVYLH